MTRNSAELLIRDQFHDKIIKYLCIANIYVKQSEAALVCIMNKLYPDKDLLIHNQSHDQEISIINV